MMETPLIVADENIAHAAEAFAQFGEVRLAAGRDIRGELLAGAEALIVRSITRVDPALLEGTPVRFVGTATIGTEHIDRDYLDRQGIAFADAAGGGARSVAEYIVAALLTLRERGSLAIAGQRLGLIGVGAIGSKVSCFARLLGMEVVEHDPPRADADPGFRSAPVADVLDCDVIVPAVPLTVGGPYPTRHMLDARFLSRLKPEAVVINTSRGGVVDSHALAFALESNRLRNAVLDVWEEEPGVPTALLEHCSPATPHIAGYSQDGKLKGTEMMADGLARYFGRRNTWSVRQVLPPVAGRVDVTGLAPLDAVRSAARTAYDIEADSRGLRQTFSLPEDERRKAFDRLRKNYPVRREFPAWQVRADRQDTRTVLEGLGFAVIG